MSVSLVLLDAKSVGSCPCGADQPASRRAVIVVDPDALDWLLADRWPGGGHVERTPLRLDCVADRWCYRRG